MVWKETCKFGIHTGRTLRKPWEPVSSGDRGFLTKTVANTNINFTDKDINRYLKKFHVQDGLDDEEVAKESRNHRRWGFRFGRGFSDDSVLYAIGKRKRWLLPAILTEEIFEDYDSENDYKAVLVERLSVNSYLYSPSPRLRRGDCKAVVDGEELRKPKRRKFAHVGDLRKETNKTEIVYEVNHTEPSSVWPNFIQHNNKWRESRPGKAQCKAKGEKNKRRTWGGYKKFELKRQECDNQQRKTFDCNVDKDKREEKWSEIHEKSSKLHDRNLNFDIESYITKSPTVTSNRRKNVKKHMKITSNKNERISKVNPASSHAINLHGKGSVIYVDPATPQHGYNDNSNTADFDSGSAGFSAPLTVERIVSRKAVSLTVDVDSERFESQKMHEQFGDAYQEGSSLPRRFSICPTNELSKFVFTCQPHADQVGFATEKVTVTVVSNELPSKQSKDCKEFLCNGFGISLQESVTEEKSRNYEINTADHNPGSKTRVAVMSFDLLCDINKWSYKVSSPSLAVANDLLCNHVNTQANGTMTCQDNSTIIPDAVLCEICCSELYHDPSDEALPSGFSCTALKSCAHWFCNECWKSYLSTEINQGKITIKCPSSDCDTLVDDITIMALLPERFLQFSTMRQEKYVETSTSWKWCPGDKCKLAVMATQTAKNQDGIVPMPVSCSCGQSWCFGCQSEPHWPASCAEAALFHAKTETYAKLIRNITGGITSINVKRCPHCTYPIEKNHGCPHMSCIMCKGEFCWTCLGHWDEHGWGGGCSKQRKEEEEVELIDDVGSTRFNYHSQVAIAHRIKRAAPVLYTKYRMVKKLQESLDKEHLESTLKSVTSATSLFLRLFSSHDVPKYLKASADLKFQVHLVIEGVSILMAVSKTKSYHVSLRRRISTLLFILDRLEVMANGRHFCTDIDKIRFQRLFDAGKHCIDCIRKLCIKIYHN